MILKNSHQKKVQEKLPDDYQKTLTPTTIEDDNQYKTVLNLARRLQEGDSLNIALTGPYGSGKSSILRTLMQKFPNYQYLNISLATLKSSLDRNIESKDEEIDILNARIEYSILQQLEYKEKQETLYNSRFKRIYHKSKLQQFMISLALVVYVMCLVVVFEPSFLRVEWIIRYLSNQTLNKCADILSLIYIFGATVYGIQMIIKSLGNSKLNKLNLREGEIELQEENSVFNRHLDEIIYFFQVTKYNVVVLEDLDRFNNTEIFLKLREVNQLLNQSKAIGRKIVFIYAVRDDMFLDEERTKFFDYITTVIPIINSSNSADMLKSELESKQLSGLSDEIVESIAFFIDDMRLLKNIVNEYAQYREKLGTNLDQNKLLAMIVYKNYYPKDFADLHKGEGIVYKCLHMKESLLEERNKQIDKKIDEITKKLKCEEVTHALQEKELRLIYVEAYVSHLRKSGVETFMCFVLGDASYIASEIAEEESRFNTFIQQPEVSYRHFLYRYSSCYSHTGSAKIEFNNIERAVNKDFTYAERLASIRDGEMKYREQIKALELSRNNHYATPIQQLLRDINMQEHDLFKGINVPKMLESFLKEGLINEDYFDYISFFFGKSINKHDHDFVMEMKLGHLKPYNYPIDKVDQCIKNIPQKSYNSITILNIQIVDYICQHLDESDNEAKLFAISQTITKNKKWDFLLDFYRSVEDSRSLYVYVANAADGLWKVVERLDEDDLYEAWIRFVEIDHPNKTSRIWISTHYSFLSSRIEKIGFENITNIIEKRDIIFSNIDAVSSELLEYVSANRAYMLTASNISCAFAHYRKERVEDYDRYPLNLTIIKNCEETASIKKYIYDHLEDSLIDVFVNEAAKEESPETIIELLELDNIKADTKYFYLKGQANKISLNDLDKKYWQLAIELDLIFPAWNEIYLYYEQQGATLCPKSRIFIKEHINEMEDLSSLTEQQIDALAKCVLLSNDFSIDIYDRLIQTFKNVLFVDENIIVIDDAHLKSLVKSGKLPYSVSYTEQIRDYHPNVIYDYVDKYLDENLTALDSLPSDIKMFKFLMRKPKVRLQYATQVINRCRSKMVWDTEIANLIVEPLIPHLEDYDDEIEFNLVHYCSELCMKQEIMIASIAKFENDHSEISNLLVEMGEPYSIIPDRSKKAVLLDTDKNRTILQKLQEIDYISSYSTFDNKLRVNHKRNK